MKKFILSLVFVLFTTFLVAQSGWSAGNYYAYQGQSYTECGSPYYKTDYYGRYIGTYKSCRDFVWQQQWYSGYIYLWNANTGSWYQEWREGTSWRCYWSNNYEVWLGY